MKKENYLSAHFIAVAAIIAALYVALTIIFAPISYGAIQVRISEAMIILAYYTPAAVPGLFVGCLLANYLGGAIIWDIIFGSLATLIGAWGGYKLRHNMYLVPIPNVVANTVIVPFVLRFGYGVHDIFFPLMFVYLAVGEILGSYVLGILLGKLLQPIRSILEERQ